MGEQGEASDSRGTQTKTKREVKLHSKRVKMRNYTLNELNNFSILEPLQCGFEEDLAEEVAGNSTGKVIF
jgi:hypothetical protein